jgi:hypothetical protein
MYRFNGFDGRLDRMLEAAVLVRFPPCRIPQDKGDLPGALRTQHSRVSCQVMESFTGFENRFKYSIGGTHTHTSAPNDRSV